MRPQAQHDCNTKCENVHILITIITPMRLGIWPEIIKNCHVVALPPLPPPPLSLIHTLIHTLSYTLSHKHIHSLIHTLIHTSTHSFTHSCTHSADLQTYAAVKPSLMPAKTRTKRDFQKILINPKSKGTVPLLFNSFTNYGTKSSETDSIEKFIYHQAVRNTVKQQHATTTTTATKTTKKLEKKN